MDNAYLEDLIRHGKTDVVLTAKDNDCLLASLDEELLKAVAKFFGLEITPGADDGPAYFILSGATPHSVADRVLPPLNTKLSIVEKAP